ncbi:DUF5133 domain-containing protein [Streptomyces beigongshangae]|uniref:DUF5133 domain-containing protein n=1 Tax=Streptomyces beigongshangae TaxID=2841597 RepID=UPI001C84AA7C|nr:DUF5133 domain-containing protein [Streptomyces sp. REN17]
MSKPEREPESDPHHVRTLLARYAGARIALAHASDPAWERELADVTRTLCEVTGTGSVTEAIPAADEILAAARRSAEPSRPSSTATRPPLAAA